MRKPHLNRVHVGRTRSSTVDGLRIIDLLDLKQQEASGLLAIHDQTLTEPHGWSLAFWTVMDEFPVERSIALVGHLACSPSLSEGWEFVSLTRWSHQPTVKTTDCEAVARLGKWVYVFGSDFGSQKRGVDVRRGFIARFQESPVLSPSARETLQVRATNLRLHRLINDALGEWGELPSPSHCLGRQFQRAREHLIRKARRHARGAKWAKKLLDEDWPINIEGAAFAPSGSLLLGLRFPVTADGEPIIVEIRAVEGFFAEAEVEPTVTAVWSVKDLGSRGSPVGIRDLEIVGDDIHFVVGKLDDDFFEYLEEPLYTHGCLTISSVPSANHSVTSIREFPRIIRHVEGLGLDPDGRWAYLCDEKDVIRLLLAS